MNDGGGSAGPGAPGTRVANRLAGLGPYKCSNCGAPYDPSESPRCRWCRAVLAPSVELSSPSTGPPSPATRRRSRRFVRWWRLWVVAGSAFSVLAGTSGYLVDETAARHASSITPLCGCTRSPGTTAPTPAVVGTIATPATTPPVPAAGNLAAIQPTSPNGAPVSASCVTSVPYEETSPLYLNQTYFFQLPAQPAPCLALAGLTLGPVHAPTDYGHVHLDLDLQGGTVLVPAGIGVDQSTGRTTDLFTRSAAGIVWFDKKRTLTLGQLFLEWGQPIGRDQIGSKHSLAGRSITWYVNGDAVTNPASVILHDHDEIQAWEDEQGATVAPTTSFDWPPGY